MTKSNDRRDWSDKDLEDDIRSHSSDSVLSQESRAEQNRRFMIFQIRSTWIILGLTAAGVLIGLIGLWSLFK
jgi:hypothetical protein